MRRHHGGRAQPAALLGAAVLVTVAGLAWPPALLAAGALTWIAGLLLVRRLTPRYRAIVGGLAALGIAGLLWGAAHGVRLDWRLVLAGNQPLISMLAAVSFVRLIAPRGSDPPIDNDGTNGSGPTGRSGVWQTLGAVHLFGSVINVAALDIVANRIFRSIPLPRPQLLLLSRGYSAGAFWSPFWGASAAAFTYAPAARLPVLVPVGLCLAAVGLCISGVQIARAFGTELDKFRGYPVTRAALRLPLALITLVLSAHLLLPAIPVTGVIMICAPALTVAVLLLRHPRRAPARLVGHALRSLPAMGGELAMFLSAGLLTAGFVAFVAATGLNPPLPAFGPWTAWLFVLVMVALSTVGIHPVISIAVGAAVLAPVHPDPTLFAMAGLIAWGLQAAGGPLSGLNVVLHARFHVDTFRIARWNIGYTAALVVAALPALWLTQWLAGSGR